jgi:hypothetical protein
MYVDSYENDVSRLYGSAQVKEYKNPEAYTAVFWICDIFGTDPDLDLLTSTFD